MSVAPAPRALGSYYIDNVEISAQFYYTNDTVRDSYYNGPATVSLEVEEEVAVECYCDVSIGNEVISAGVGFDVSKKFTVSDTYATTVPDGVLLEIKAWVLYKSHSFDIYFDPWVGSNSYEGKGEAIKPSGIYFDTFEY